MTQAGENQSSVGWEEGLVLLSHCSRQISHGFVWNRTREYYLRTVGI